MPLSLSIVGFVPSGPYYSPRSHFVSRARVLHRVPLAAEPLLGVAIMAEMVVGPVGLLAELHSECLRSVSVPIFVFLLYEKYIIVRL